MDFDFTDEQLELQREARRFLEQQCPTTHVREFIEDPAGWSRALWKQMADLGWMGMPFDEEVGGVGMGYMELALLLGELGRAIAPVPFLSSVGICGMAIARCGSDEQLARLLPAVATGEKVVALAWADAPEGYALDAVTMAGGPFLSGSKQVVLDAPAADAFLVAARDGDAVRLFVVEEGFEVRAQQGYDLTRTVGEVTFENAPVEPLPGDAARAWRFAVVSTCAEMIGVAQAAVDISVAYAKEREQFGRPIGGFQAIKHKLAEMHTEVDAARATVMYACWAVDSDAADADTAVSVAKSFASDACAHAAGEAIQVHGGIGYTWEHDIHLYTRRVKSLEAFMGDASYHRERLAQLIGL
jgi:alkylation response protein AidB-like acyl-CoA dehydrogenase